MTDLSKSLISIDAPIEAVQKALFELDKYPEWSSQIKSAEALAHDDQGRITKVKMTIDAGMMKDRPVLIMTGAKRLTSFLSPLMKQIY